MWSFWYPIIDSGQVGKAAILDQERMHSTGKMLTVLHTLSDVYNSQCCYMHRLMYFTHWLLIRTVH